MAKKKKVVEEAIIENILPSSLDELMGERFGIYAKDVIQDRAIPDARDGMKPVQRRIIYAMYKTGNTIDKPTKKCAHIVGEVMGKYHPHGDFSIYEALVRMSQTWRVRLPLIDFQGNNGSMDGDGPAAYRYTEARLAGVAQELVRDIDKETVDMDLTFDDLEFEPSVLPARFPNLLVNGAEGIAVGLATSIPPHNLREVIQAVICRIKNPTCTIDRLLNYVQGPDFPTGGLIYKSQGLEDIYKTGKGRIEIASKYEITVNEDGVNQIIISEIPYGVVKSDLVGSIDKIRHDKVIDGIDEVRDETDKEGLRIAIDLTPSANANAILGYLMSKTELRSSFSANMVAIVDGRPKTLDLASYCDTYISHQVDVISRRSRYMKAKDLARLEIVDGLLKAASIIDEVISIIRQSKDKADSKANLIARFEFTPEQAEAIVMMPLYKLSHTDVVALENEDKSLREEITRLDAILSDREVLNDVLITDLRKIAKDFGDDRRSQIVEDDGSLRNVNKRDLMANEDCIVVATRDGYFKRTSLQSWKSSGGEKGVLPAVKDGDSIVYMGKAQTLDFMAFFTSKGNYLFMPVGVLSSIKWNKEGLHANTAITVDSEDKMVKGFAIRSFRSDLYIAILTKFGQMKRVKVSDLKVSRYSRPIRAMRILESDEVVDACLTTGDSDLLVCAQDGGALLYNENQISASSTTSGGVKAGKFGGSPLVALLSFAPEEKGKLLLLTNLADKRIFEISKIKASSKRNAATPIFKSFKNEPHELIHIEKLGKREAPITLRALTKAGESYEVTYEDTYLTQAEYAKKGDSKLSKKNCLLRTDRLDSDLIDSLIKSYAPPVEEVVESEPNPEESEAELEEERNVPTQKFEQISIFDDDFDE